MRSKNAGGGFKWLQRLFPATLILAAAVLLILWIAGGYASRVDTFSNPDLGFSPRLPAFVVQSLDWPAAGTFLVAARGLRDPNFSQTVVLLIDYDSAGAFGLIIDRPSGHTIEELWPEIAGLEAHSLYFGGPVFAHHLLFLLRSDSAPEDTRRVFRGVYLGSDELVLKRILAEGEDEFRVYAGHAGWAPGQLDNEIARGDWYILPAERAFIFHQEPSRIWEELIQRVDIQVVSLRK